ncbi:34081_t:CDS:1, partial [Racocetra persica]
MNESMQTQSINTQPQSPNQTYIHESLEHIDQNSSEHNHEFASVSRKQKGKQKED